MAKLGSSNISHLGSFKNKIINGDFEFWQRGTSWTPVTSGTNVADRWKYSSAGDVVCNLSYDNTSLPTVAQSGHKSNYNLSVAVTTADASVAATDYMGIRYTIEGYDFRGMMGKNCTLSFWIRAYRAGTYCISLRNADTDISYVAEFTINASATWEKKTITIPIPDGTSGTWNKTNGAGLYIAWSFMCGSTYQTTPNAWASGNYLATASITNGAASTSDYFQLSQVQFEVGSQATAFEEKSHQQELALCQRYYFKTISAMYIPRGYSNEGYISFQFPVTMRISPTKTWTVNADTNNLNADINGIIGYIIDDWTGSPSISAGAIFDAEI